MTQFQVGSRIRLQTGNDVTVETIRKIVRNTEGFYTVRFFITNTKGAFVASDQSESEGLAVRPIGFPNRYNQVARLVS